MKRSLLLLSLVCFVNASAQIDHWEQLVNAHDSWTYFKGNSEPASNWNTTSFNDSAWPSGYGSIGYGNNDDSTQISVVSSIYMRHTFQIQHKDSILSLILHADYDDGFVAYLNGVEVARANISDSLKPPAYNSSPEESRQPTTYNGPTTWGAGLPGVWIVNDSIKNQALVNGQNVLAIHTLDSSNTFDLTTKYWLHSGTSRTNYYNDSAASWFEFNAFESNSAVVRVNTFGRDIFRQYRVKGEVDIVWDMGNAISSYSGETHLTSKISIRKRGNGSLFSFPKNGYLFEFKDKYWSDTDRSPLGLPEEEDWILHGPWVDRTYARNALTMHLVREQGHYASRTAITELFVNGEYEGIYILMENIKRDNNRVDIAKLKPDEISGDDLTGGYIWRIDWGDEDWFSSFYPWNSTTTKLKYQYFVPSAEDIVPEQETYLQTTVDDFEQALQNTSVSYKGKYWDEYIDVNSFVDYFLIQELTKNFDAYRASSYFHKDKDSKDSTIKAGPVWDLNYSLGLTFNCQGYIPSGWSYSGACASLGPNWWTKLVQDATFANRVNCRWQELRQGPWHKDSIFDFLDAQEIELLGPSQRDRERWYIEYGNPPHYAHFIDSTVTGDMNYMKTWITDRLDWMDTNMIGSPCSLGFSNTNTHPDIRVFPNPTAGIIRIEFYNHSFDELTVRNALGQTVHWNEISNDDHNLKVDLQNYQSGIYFIELANQKTRFFEKVILN